MLLFWTKLQTILIWQKFSGAWESNFKNTPISQKFLLPYFRRTYAFSVGFKKKPLRKPFSCGNAKSNSNFAVKLVQKSNRSFSVYLKNHLFQTFVFFNMWWLSENMKKVRSSQASISISSCSELSKTAFPMIIVKLNMLDSFIQKY